MRLTKSTVTNISLVVVAALGGWFAYDTVGLPTQKASATAQRTATIGTGTVMTTISSSGNVTAPNNINVNFGTAGKLTEIDVKVGDKVKQGQVLAKLDSTAAKASLDSANAQLASAQEKLTELQSGVTSLVAQGLQLSVEQAGQQVASAQASLANAQQQVGLDTTQADTNISQAQDQLSRDQATADQDTTTFQANVDQANTQYNNDEAQYSQDVAAFGSKTQSQLTSDAAALAGASSNANSLNLTVADDKRALSNVQAQDQAACT
ncbi:MAG: efflux RND transporter periplasmic adaptor subunit, partial [Acidothermaceae bacterium]